MSEEKQKEKVVEEPKKEEKEEPVEEKPQTKTVAMMDAERISRLEDLRVKAMEQTELHSKKQRFDLFSQKPPIGVGAAFYDTKRPARDPESGGVILQERNIQTNPMKKGRTQTVYFDSKVWSETEKYPDPYLDPSKRYNQGRDPKKVKIKKKKEEEGEKPISFFPAVTKWAMYKGKDQEGKKATRFGNPYPHIDGPPRIKKRKIKNAEGRVIIKERNIQSEPVRHGKYNSTIRHTINPYPKYMDEKKKDTRAKRKKTRDTWNKYYNDSKGGPFKARSHTKHFLNTHRKVYGTDRPPARPIKEIKIIRKRKKDDGAVGPEAFRPSHNAKLGTLDTFGKFNRLIPHPRKRKVRVKGNKGDLPPAKQAFKPSRNYLTRPTPSVTLNTMNLRACL